MTASGRHAPIISAAALAGSLGLIVVFKRIEMNDLMDGSTREGVEELA